MQSQMQTKHILFFQKRALQFTMYFLMLQRKDCQDLSKVFYRNLINSTETNITVLVMVGCLFPTLHCIVQPTAGGREMLFSMAQGILSGFFTFQTGGQANRKKTELLGFFGGSCPDVMKQPHCGCFTMMDGTAGRAAGALRANTALGTQEQKVEQEHTCIIECSGPRGLLSYPKKTRDN